MWRYQSRPRQHLGTTAGDESGHERQASCHVAGELERLHRSEGVLEPGSCQQLDLARHPVWAPPIIRRNIPAIRIGVQQDREDLGAGHSVDGGVVQLGEGRHPAILETLDQIQLPERAGTIQRSCVDPRHQLRQLSAIARRWHGDVTDVEIEIELGVLDPVRVIEAEGNGHEFAAKRREQVDPAGDERSERLEVESIRGRGRVQDDHAGDVTVLGRRLEVEEAGVESGELLHG